jgi:hypothetical protein
MDLDLTQVVPFAGDGDEVTTALGSLDRIRRTFGWKCADLGPEGLRQTVAASAVTLGALLKHLALCELHYFVVQLRGEPMPEPFGSVDWDADPDWEWRTSADDSPEELMALWVDAVAQARRGIAASVAEAGGLGGLGQERWPTGGPNLRRVVSDMHEEYARHTGHADLIREAVDGRTGEDAPEEYQPWG